MRETPGFFNSHAREYDDWFEKHLPVYHSELAAVRAFVDENEKGLEIGAGTGRFALPLGIKEGVEPAEKMAEIARSRGIRIHNAYAEKLPLADESFDFVLFSATLCFIKDPEPALREARRVIKNKGRIILAILDKGSPQFEAYLGGKQSAGAYKNAYFHTAEELTGSLTGLNFTDIRTKQTLFRNPYSIKEIEPVKSGCGEGLFAVIAARKPVVIPS